MNTLQENILNREEKSIFRWDLVLFYGTLGTFKAESCNISGLKMKNKIWDHAARLRIIHSDSLIFVQLEDE